MMTLIRVLFAENPMTSGKFVSNVAKIMIILKLTWKRLAGGWSKIT
jgi:hypothetical protein